MEKKNEIDVVRVGLSPWANMKPLCLNETYDCDPGLELNILKMVGQLLNFTLELKISTEPGCGSKNSNGTWTGLMGMLYRNEIDITGNVCLMDQRRTDVTWLANTVPILQDQQAFLIKAPTPEFSFDLGAPFQLISWLLFTTVFILFLVALTAYSKVSRETSLRSGLTKSFVDLLDLSIGLELYPINLLHFAYLLFFGVVLMLYSTYITAALIKPVTTGKPISNYREAIQKLSTGEYKWLDDRKLSNGFRCFEECEKMRNALVQHGYVYIDPNSHGFEENFFRPLVDEDNVFYANSEAWIRFFLDKFKPRSQLWLISDNEAAASWSAYFHTVDFRYAHVINRYFNLIGSAKDNQRFHLFGLSKLVIQSEFIKGDIPDETPISYQLISRPMFLFFFGILISCSALIIERLSIAKNHSEGV